MEETHQNNSQNAAPTVSDPDLKRLDAIAKLLDNQFRIPGTEIRFGLDGIVGLIPYAGDIAGFVVSGFLFLTMWRRGAGPVVMLRMMGNVLVDTVVGVVPFLGDIFDFGFKANRRNVELLKQYYADGGTKPAAKRSILLLSLLFVALFIGICWLIWRGISALFSSFI